MAEDLADLLEELRARGVLDSTDEFGVDLVRAETKMGRFQLADPGFYLLKILQAAALAAPAEVKLWLTQGEVRLTFQAPVSDSDVQRLGDSRTLGEHLMIGLRAAQAAAAGEVAWEAWSGRRGARVQVSEDGGLRVNSTDRCPARLNGRGYAFSLRRPRTFYQALFGTFPNLSAEHNAVCTRTVFFPVPLRLDGRPVNGGPDSLVDGPRTLQVAGQGVHSNSYLMRRLLIARQPALTVHLPACRLTELEGQVQEHPRFVHDLLFFQRPSVYYSQYLRIDHDQPWFPVDSGPPCREASPACYVDLRLPVRLEGPGLVYFVKAGVTLSPVEADLGCAGVRAVVSLPVTTDLSQFAAVQNPALEKVCLYLKAHVRTMLTAVERQLPRLRLDHPELYEYFCQKVRRR